MGESQIRQEGRLSVLSVLLQARGGCLMAGCALRFFDITCMSTKVRGRSISPVSANRGLPKNAGAAACLRPQLGGECRDVDRDGQTRLSS